LYYELSERITVTVLSSPARNLITFADQCPGEWTDTMWSQLARIGGWAVGAARWMSQAQEIYVNECMNILTHHGVVVLTITHSPFHHSS
jgi:hypothetical protein